MTKKTRARKSVLALPLSRAAAVVARAVCKRLIADQIAYQKALRKQLKNSIGFSDARYFNNLIDVVQGEIVRVRCLQEELTGKAEKEKGRKP